MLKKSSGDIENIKKNTKKKKNPHNLLEMKQ